MTTIYIEKETFEINQIKNGVHILHLGSIHTTETHHHHPPQQTNTLNIQQKNRPPHESLTVQQLFDPEQQRAHHHPHNVLPPDLVKLLDPATGLPISSRPLSQVTTESNHNEHLHDLPIPSQFQQQHVLDPPSNALQRDYSDTPQDGDHSHHKDGGLHDHNDLDHHGHHKHKDHTLEEYHLPDDVLLKISPRGHSSGPVIISQVSVIYTQIHTQYNESQY